MIAIAANALYTTLHRRGTTRQLASVIIICVICALLLLPAVVWYNMRFSSEQASISLPEVQVALAYVALCGWFLPLSVTASYCFFTSPRLSTTSVEIPLQKRPTSDNPANGLLHPPRHQPGVPAPFVFNEETPWGWLEYRGGRFQGQRLALKRAVVTIGRDENNDIWIEDDMASRHHAELAWDEGRICLTDCDSLNGVLLNGKRIRGTVQVEAEEPLEIGSQRFIFLLAEKPEPMLGVYDPLVNHTWRSSLDSLTSVSNVLPATRPLQEERVTSTDVPNTSVGGVLTDDRASRVSEEMVHEWQETAALNKVTPLPTLPERNGALLIRGGEMEGKSFPLDHPVITIGRGIECNIVMNDVSISRQHAQFLRQASGDYVQDLTSRNGTLVNDEPLVGPRLLQIGDRIRLGNVNLEYTFNRPPQEVGFPQIITSPSFARSLSGPVPLRLPSKPKG